MCVRCANVQQFAAPLCPAKMAKMCLIEEVNTMSSGQGKGASTYDVLKGVLNSPILGILDVYITPLPCPHLHQPMSITYPPNLGVFLTSPSPQCGSNLRTALRWFASQRVSLLKTWTITAKLQGRYINGQVPGAEAHSQRLAQPVQRSRCSKAGWW